MSLLIRRYKSSSGVMQEERIDDPDRIDRYMRIFEKEIKRRLEGWERIKAERKGRN